MAVVCVSRLLFGFLLLVVKLSGKEGAREDAVLFNHELLLHLGLVQPTDSVENSRLMLPHGVLLFRRIIFARRLVRFNCLLLLLCGDILPNPGPPPRYPCGVCWRAVRPSDKALLCDNCDKWFHVECTRVSSEEYDHYSTLDQFDWSCLLCLFDALPPDDVCDSHIISTCSDVRPVDSNDSLLLPSDIF